METNEKKKDLTSSGVGGDGGVGGGMGVEGKRKTVKDLAEKLYSCAHYIRFPEITWEVEPLVFC